MATAVAASSRADAWFAARAKVDRKRLLLVLLGAVLVACYPFVDSALGIGRLGSFIPIFVFVLLALGLNVVVGYAGLLDLGYVAFFVIGAYANAWMTSPNSVFVQKGWVPEWMQNFWVAMALSWVVSAIFGVILGAPTLRLRGDYLAIVTLGLGEIVPDFVTNATSITNGPQGIGQIARPPSITIPGVDALGLSWNKINIGFSTADQRNWFWLIVVVTMFSVFLVTRLYDSRLGRAWQAMREDEIAAASMGINLVRTKLWAFALGASFSGFAGSIYAGYITQVTPDQFQFTISIMVLSMVILGGIGNVYGVIFGAILIGSFDRILTEELTEPMHKLGDWIGWEFLQEHHLSQDRLLIFGLSLVLVMVLRPGGLFPSRQRSAEMKDADPDAPEVAEP